MAQLKAWLIMVVEQIGLLVLLAYLSFACMCFLCLLLDGGVVFGDPSRTLFSFWWSLIYLTPLFCIYGVSSFRAVGRKPE